MVPFGLQLLLTILLPLTKGAIGSESAVTPVDEGLIRALFAKERGADDAAGVAATPGRGAAAIAAPSGFVVTDGGCTECNKGDGVTIPPPVGTASELKLAPVTGEKGCNAAPTGPLRGCSKVQAVEAPTVGGAVSGLFSILGLPEVDTSAWVESAGMVA